MAKLKAFLKSVFDSPYLDKADIVLVVAAASVLFGFHLSVDKQAALITVLGAVYVIAHKISNTLTSK
jgi:small basic protein